MPASASLSIPGLVDQLGGVELPNPVTVAPELRTVLAQVTDPRKPCGVRHGLVVVLSTAVCGWRPGRARSWRSPSGCRPAHRGGRAPERRGQLPE